LSAVNSQANYFLYAFEFRKNTPDRIVHFCEIFLQIRRRSAKFFGISYDFCM